MVVTMKKAERVSAQERGANGCRDRELVRLVGRHGAMTVEQVMRAMGCGRTITYERVARCIEGGLIERTSIPGVSPAILHATRQGLSYARLGLPVVGISPASIEHLLRCTSVAVLLERKLGPGCLLTEREIVLEEQIEERPIASVPVGVFRDRPRMHRADIAFQGEGGLVAVEVELTPKSPARLRRIIEAWAGEVGAGRLSEVHYLCEPESQTWRAVERAIVKAAAKGGVHLLEVPS
jgi:hypothetical protein